VERCINGIERCWWAEDSEDDNDVWRRCTRFFRILPLWPLIGLPLKESPVCEWINKTFGCTKRCHFVFSVGSIGANRNLLKRDLKIKVRETCHQVTDDKTISQKGKRIWVGINRGGGGGTGTSRFDQGDQVKNK
jgi:hypothetical protein